MNTLTKPLPDRLGEIETEEEEAAYTAWMRKMVQEADDDPRPGIPHDVVMAELQALVAQIKASQAQKSAV